VIDHGTASREAIAAPDVCRDLARETGARKFRLEGTPGGNSRLLFLSTAQRLQAKFGGRIVNYRPRAELSPLEQAARDADLPACPYCGVRTGAACRRVTAWWPGPLGDPVPYAVGRRCRPHAVRLTSPAENEP
jgi:hypothetical protein